MEIILKQDMPGLGDKDDIISVKNGYGRNYLIPKGIGILATESARKVHAENLRQRAHKEEKIKAAAEEIAAKLADIKLSLGAKTSTSGKIFGSVNTIQLSQALLDQYKFDIDRKMIEIDGDSIKDLGDYVAKIKLHRDVIVDVKFEVIGE